MAVVAAAAAVAVATCRRDVIVVIKSAMRVDLRFAVAVLASGVLPTRFLRSGLKAVHRARQLLAVRAGVRGAGARGGALRGLVASAVANAAGAQRPGVVV